MPDIWHFLLDNFKEQKVLPSGKKYHLIYRNCGHIQICLLMSPFIRHPEKYFEVFSIYCSRKPGIFTNGTFPTNVSIDKQELINFIINRMQQFIEEKRETFNRNQLPELLVVNRRYPSLSLWSREYYSNTGLKTISEGYWEHLSFRNRKTETRKGKMVEGYFLDLNLAIQNKDIEIFPL